MQDMYLALYFGISHCIHVSSIEFFFFAQGPIENQRPVFSSASYQHILKIIAYRVQILKLKHQKHYN